MPAADILSRRIVPVADAAESFVGDETIILHLRSGIYFGLDATGTKVWKLLKQGLTPTEICKRLTEEHDADRETVEADVRHFLTELQTHQMIADA